MEITFLQGLWFVLIFVLIAIYLVLDGFDLGAAILMPFVAKNDEERAVVRRSVGPVWDGNEVWLLTAGGALFAAFPEVYATTFSGFYLAIMLVLFGLIIRAVAVEYASFDKKWSKFWNWAFVIGSFVPALLFGVAIGNVYAGISMDAAGNYNGFPLFGLITPFTLLTGLLGLSLILAQGVTWLALKAPKPSDMQARADKLRMPLQVAVLVLFAIVTIYALAIVQPEMTGGVAAVLRVLFAIIVVAAIVLSILAGRKGCDLRAFVLQSVAAAFTVFLLAASMFPNFVVASASSIGETITAMAAASSELTLGCMTVITCIFLPIVLIYTIYVYYKFRGRVTPEDLAH